MKYFSETLNKLFDTEDALNKAENELKAKNESIAEQKKKYATAIEEAEKNAKASYEAYESVKKDANKILSDARQIANSLLKEAKDNVLKAEDEWAHAVIEFNDKFGPYKTTYTGEDAKLAAKKANSLLDEIFSSMFWVF